MSSRALASGTTRVLPLALAHLACSPAATGDQAAPPQHAHAEHGHHHDPAQHAHHHGGQGPLVHGFGGDPAQWAKEFDNPERDAWQKPAEVVALLQLAAGMKVADIGAGTGYFEPHLSRAVGPGGSVLALDVEDGMVKHLTERAQRESLANVRAAKAEYGDPKLAPASVDRILIVDTWHHIAEREAYSFKLREALVPGGFVAVVDFTLEATHGPPKEHRVTAEQTKKELESAGLKGEIASETLPEQYVVIARKPAP